MAVPDGWLPARVRAGAQNPAYRPARPPPQSLICAPVCSRPATGDTGGNVGDESFAPLPATAAWRHRGARSGFEVVYFGARDDWRRIQGWTTAVEDGATWVVEYVVEADAAWATRSARIRGRSIEGPCSAMLEADGAGHWLINGEPAPHLDGCLDIDRSRLRLPLPSGLRPVRPGARLSRHRRRRRLTGRASSSAQLNAPHAMEKLLVPRAGHGQAIIAVSWLLRAWRGFAR